MVAIFANEIFSKSEYFGIKDKLLQGLKSLRPQIEYSQLTDSLSFSPIVGDISYPDKTLEELMQILDSGKRPCVIAIDEFQKIRDFKEANMEAYLMPEYYFYLYWQYYAFNDKYVYLSGETIL